MGYYAPPSLQKRGFFYDVAFSGFIGNVFEKVKNGERLWAIAPPSFVKRGQGDLTIPIYRKFP